MSHFSSTPLNRWISQHNKFAKEVGIGTHDQEKELEKIQKQNRLCMHKG